MPTLGRYFWLLAAAAELSACAARRLAPVAVAPSAKSPTVLSAAPPKAATDEPGPRLFPPLEGSATLTIGQERDGSERLISYGLRVLSRPDGAIEQADEYLPAARGAQSLELPSRLGGGFLFFVLSSNATLFFRAATFTGELEPFARLDFEADQVVAGFDRLYVVSHRPERLVALDAEHGTSLDLGSLPPSPGYGKMAFVDAWFGAVQVPLRGTLVSFDAGGSWRPLSSTVTNVTAEAGELRLFGPDGTQSLDRNGVLSRRDDPAAASGNHENEVARALRAATAGADDTPPKPDLAGQHALKLAVLRGFRDADGTLVVASSGSLSRVRASDGKLLASDGHAYAGSGECNALQYGKGFAFACSEGTSRTTLFSFVPPFAMQELRAFAGARYVASSGNGALVIRGGCAGSTPGPSGAYCIAGSAGNFREIRVRGDLGVERVVALADGRVAVVVPPRLAAPGFLSLIDSASKEQRDAAGEDRRARDRVSTLAGGSHVDARTHALVLLAPIAGTVTTLAAGVGAFINDTTSPLMTLSGLDRVFVTAQVPELQVAAIAPGTPVDVTLTSAAGQIWHGKAARVSPMLEADTRRAKIRIPFDNADGRLRPNAFATATFALPEPDSVSVPPSALVMNNDSTTVMVEVAPWTFVRRVVELGAEDEHSVRIVSGLKRGERVLVRGGVLLQ